MIPSPVFLCPRGAPHDGRRTWVRNDRDREVAVAGLCEQILAKKTGSMLSTRRLLRPRDLESCLEAEGERFVEQTVTEEAMNGIETWLGND
jgi:hypothetical protein